MSFVTGMLGGQLEERELEGFEGGARVDKRMRGHQQGGDRQGECTLLMRDRLEEDEHAKLTRGVERPRYVLSGEETGASSLAEGASNLTKQASSAAFSRVAVSLPREASPPHSPPRGASTPR